MPKERSERSADTNDPTQLASDGDAVIGGVDAPTPEELAAARETTTESASH